MSARALRTMVWLVVVGVILYLLEGCAGSGKQELWERCAHEIHNDCWEAEDVLDCGYEYYRACIDGI